MRNKEIYKSILHGVKEISKSIKDNIFNEELIQSLKQTAEPLLQFFKIPLEEVVVLSYFIDANLRDINVSKDNIIDTFGKDITSLADVDDIIESLNKRKLIFLSKRSQKFTRQYKSIILNPKVQAAIAEGNPNLMGVSQCSNFVELLMEVRDLTEKRKDEHISTEELIAEVNPILDNVRNLKEVKWIKRQKLLRGKDLLIFLNICFEHAEGDEEVDIDRLINAVIDYPTTRMKYKQSIKSNRCILFAKNYIESSGNIFGLMNMVKLSDDSMSNTLSSLKNDNVIDFSPRMGILINSEKILDEKLYYNLNEKNQIHTLLNALSETNYSELMKNMKSSNLSPGFTVLFYGAAGTGKTASVKSIAKSTGRHIFMVDIPRINSKWVGESEKNLSKLFDEYKRARKIFNRAPILLFNEADAILGRRVSNNSSLDKMNNTLQNILLQELEDFEGIFMATTNLANNLDTAFDRRLLYKVEFSKPGPDVSKEILSNSFPNIDSIIIESLVKKYQLTGGQISNIKKKLLVKNLLNPKFNQQEEIFSMCEEEISLRNSGRSIIGFKN